MNEIILLKQGEMVLKGLNKKIFEQKLVSNLHWRLKKVGNFKVYSLQSTIYIEPLDNEADIEKAYTIASKTFGPATITKAVSCNKNMKDISETAIKYVESRFQEHITYKVEAKRSDKSFPLNSQEISREIGGILSDVYPNVSAEMRHPDETVNIEIRDNNAYIHFKAKPAAGGMPVGTNGNGLLLLSGGIDSPVAGYMMARRGVSLKAIHFFSPPYTSERAKRKVLQLARIMQDYTGKIDVYVVPFTEIQEAIRDNCKEDFFTIIMRRFMVRVANGIAEREGCKCLITGESLGQVASQTMEAIGVTENVSKFPIFRPCIGLDKEQIVQISRKIETFETSIEPYEDCCTVFTPKHPKTKPAVYQAENEEASLDIDGLVQRAIDGTYLEEVPHD